MWALLILLSLPIWAQEENFDDLDLKTLQALDEELPSAENIKPAYIPKPTTAVPLIVAVDGEDIKASGTGYGVVKSGKKLIRLSDNRTFRITDSFTTKYFLKEDELGFKHLVDKNGNSFYKVDSKDIININAELELYEPPLRYTPAPTLIVHTEYDKQLNLRPEVSVYAGIVQGDYMSDLFNDKSAVKGTSTQIGLHYYTQWKLPVAVGAVLHYEKSKYDLNGSGSVTYTAPSIGPQFKTKNFDVFGAPWRFQGQFRVSPFVSVTADTLTGHETFKFNSADLLASIEHPVQNDWGEFVVGFFYQSQWLNIRSQKKNVSINASNETNKSMGISLSQAFQ